MKDNVTKLDHIGIAVRDIEKAMKSFRDILGLEFGGGETVEEQKVKTAFLRVGETNIELLEPTSDDSPVASFLDKKGEGIHHIAIGVKDIESVIAKLKERGAVMIDEKPRTGAHGKKIAFIHPRSTSGVLTEVCEYSDSQK
ncbi:MAG TPA: methylmalonyl-CoA epimerase [bacterium]|nr:methylmalonyl-CoA epimerase [bacterium]